MRIQAKLKRAEPDTRINVRLPNDLAADVLRICSREYINMSQFTRIAFKAYIEADKRQIGEK